MLVSAVTTNMRRWDAGYRKRSGSLMAGHAVQILALTTAASPAAGARVRDGLAMTADTDAVRVASQFTHVAYRYRRDVTERDRPTVSGSSRAVGPPTRAPDADDPASGEREDLHGVPGHRLPDRCAVPASSAHVVVTARDEHRPLGPGHAVSAHTTPEWPRWAVPVPPRRRHPTGVPCRRSRPTPGPDGRRAWRSGRAP